MSELQTPNSTALSLEPNSNTTTATTNRNRLDQLLEWRKQRDLEKIAANEKKRRAPAWRSNVKPDATITAAEERRASHDQRNGLADPLHSTRTIPHNRRQTVDALSTPSVVPVADEHSSSSAASPARSAASTVRGAPRRTTTTSHAVARPQSRPATVGQHTAAAVQSVGSRFVVPIRSASRSRGSKERPATASSTSIGRPAIEQPTDDDLPASSHKIEHNANDAPPPCSPLPVPVSNSNNVNTKSDNIIYNVSPKLQQQSTFAGNTRKNSSGTLQHQRAAPVCTGGSRRNIRSGSVPADNRTFSAQPRRGVAVGKRGAGNDVSAPVQVAGSTRHGLSGRAFAKDVGGTAEGDLGRAVEGVVGVVEGSMGGAMGDCKLLNGVADCAGGAYEYREGDAGCAAVCGMMLGDKETSVVSGHHNGGDNIHTSNGVTIDTAKSVPLLLSSAVAVHLNVAPSARPDAPLGDAAGACPALVRHAVGVQTEHSFATTTIVDTDPKVTPVCTSGICTGGNTAREVEKATRVVLDTFTLKLGEHVEATRLAMDSNSTKLDKVLDAVHRTLDIVNTLSSVHSVAGMTSGSVRAAAGHTYSYIHSSPNSDLQKKIARKRRLSANLEHTGGIVDGMCTGPDSAPPATLNTNDILLGSSGLNAMGRSSSRFPYMAGGAAVNFTPCSFALTDSLSFSDAGADGGHHTGDVLGSAALAGSGYTPVRISRSHYKQHSYAHHPGGTGHSHSASMGLGGEDSSRMGMFWNSNLVHGGSYNSKGMVVQLPSIPSETEEGDLHQVLSSDERNVDGRSQPPPTASVAGGGAVLVAKPSSAAAGDEDDDDSCSDVCGEIIGAKLNMMHYEDLVGSNGTAGQPLLVCPPPPSQDANCSSKESVENRLVEACSEELTSLLSTACISGRRDVSERELLSALDSSAKMAGCSINEASSQVVAKELHSRTRALFDEPAPDMQRLGCFIEEILSSVDLRSLLLEHTTERQTTPTPRVPPANTSPDTAAYIDAAAGTTAYDAAADGDAHLGPFIEGVVTGACGGFEGHSGDKMGSGDDSCDSMVPQPTSSFMEKEMDSRRPDCGAVKADERYEYLGGAVTGSSIITTATAAATSIATAVSHDVHSDATLVGRSQDRHVGAGASEPTTSANHCDSYAWKRPDVGTAAQPSEVSASSAPPPTTTYAIQQQQQMPPLSRDSPSPLHAVGAEEGGTAAVYLGSLGDASTLSSINLQSAMPTHAAALHSEEHSAEEHRPDGSSSEVVNFETYQQAKWTPVHSAGAAEQGKAVLPNGAIRDYMPAAMNLGLSTGSFRSVQSPESPFNMLDTAYRDSRHKSSTASGAPTKSPLSPVSVEAGSARGLAYSNGGDAYSEGPRPLSGGGPVFPSLQALGVGGGDGDVDSSPRSHASSPLFDDNRKDDFCSGGKQSLLSSTLEGTAASDQGENTAPAANAAPATPVPFR